MSSQTSAPDYVVGRRLSVGAAPYGSGSADLDGDGTPQYKDVNARPYARQSQYAPPAPPPSTSFAPASSQGTVPTDFTVTNNQVMYIIKNAQGQQVASFPTLAQANAYIAAHTVATATTTPLQAPVPTVVSGSSTGTPSSSPPQDESSVEAAISQYTWLPQSAMISILQQAEASGLSPDQQVAAINAALGAGYGASAPVWPTTTQQVQVQGGVTTATIPISLEKGVTLAQLQSGAPPYTTVTQQGNSYVFTTNAPPHTETQHTPNPNQPWAGLANAAFAVANQYSPAPTPTPPPSWTVNGKTYTSLDDAIASTITPIGGGAPGLPSYAGGGLPTGYKVTINGQTYNTTDLSDAQGIASGILQGNTSGITQVGPVAGFSPGVTTFATQAGANAYATQINQKELLGISSGNIGLGGNGTPQLVTTTVTYPNGKPVYAGGTTGSVGAVAYGGTLYPSITAASAANPGVILTDPFGFVYLSGKTYTGLSGLESSLVSQVPVSANPYQANSLSGLWQINIAGQKQYFQNQADALSVVSSAFGGPPTTVYTVGKVSFTSQNAANAFALQQAASQAVQQANQSGAVIAEVTDANGVLHYFSPQTGQELSQAQGLSLVNAIGAAQSSSTFLQGLATSGTPVSGNYISSYLTSLGSNIPSNLQTQFGIGLTPALQGFFSGLPAGTDVKVLQGANGYEFVPVYNEGQLQALGGITEAGSGALSLRLPGSAASSYTLNIGAQTLVFPKLSEAQAALGELNSYNLAVANGNSAAQAPQFYQAGGYSFTSAAAANAYSQTKLANIQAAIGALSSVTPTTLSTIQGVTGVTTSFKDAVGVTYNVQTQFGNITIGLGPQSSAPITPAVQGAQNAANAGTGPLVQLGNTVSSNPLVKGFESGVSQVAGLVTGAVSKTPIGQVATAVAPLGKSLESGFGSVTGTIGRIFPTVSRAAVGAYSTVNSANNQLLNVLGTGVSDITVRSLSLGYETGRLFHGQPLVSFGQAEQTVNSPNFRIGIGKYSVTGQQYIQGTSVVGANVLEAGGLILATGGLGLVAEAGGVSAEAANAVFGVGNVLKTATAYTALNAGLSYAFGGVTPTAQNLAVSFRQGVFSAPAFNALSLGLGAITTRGVSAVGGPKTLAGELVSKVSPIVSSGGIFAGFGAAQGQTSLQQITQNFALGGILGIGGDFLGRIKVERVNTIPESGTSAGALSYYRSPESEPVSIISVSKSQGELPGLRLGTPKVPASSIATSDVTTGDFYPFRSTLDVKTFGRSLSMSPTTPSEEITAFTTGKSIIYGARGANLPTPETLNIEVKDNPALGAAAKQVLTSPDASAKFGDVTIAGSSSFRAGVASNEEGLVTTRQGADLDVKGISSAQAQKSLADAIASKANSIVGRQLYGVRESQGAQVFNLDTGVRVTDFHLAGETIPGYVEPNQTFGLPGLETIKVEGASLRNPLETLTTKGRSTLTPRVFTAEGAQSASAQLSRSEFPEFANYLDTKLTQTGGQGFAGTSPGIGRFKDVADFIAESQVVNQRFLNGALSSDIKTFTDVQRARFGPKLDEAVQAAMVNLTPEQAVARLQAERLAPPTNAVGNLAGQGPGIVGIGQLAGIGGRGIGYAFSEGTREIYQPLGPQPGSQYEVSSSRIGSGEIGSSDIWNSRFAGVSALGAESSSSGAGGSSFSNILRNYGFSSSGPSSSQSSQISRGRSASVTSQSALGQSSMASLIGPSLVSRTRASPGYTVSLSNALASSNASSAATGTSSFSDYVKSLLSTSGSSSRVGSSAIGSSSVSSGTSAYSVSRVDSLSALGSSSGYSPLSTYFLSRTSPRDVAVPPTQQLHKLPSKLRDIEYFHYQRYHVLSEDILRSFSNQSLLGISAGKNAGSSFRVGRLGSNLDLGILATERRRAQAAAETGIVLPGMALPQRRAQVRVPGRRTSTPNRRATTAAPATKASTSAPAKPSSGSLSVNIKNVLSPFQQVDPGPAFNQMAFGSAGSETPASSAAFSVAKPQAGKNGLLAGLENAVSSQVGKLARDEFKFRGDAEVVARRLIDFEGVSSTPATVKKKFQGVNDQVVKDQMSFG